MLFLQIVIHCVSVLGVSMYAWLCGCVGGFFWWAADENKSRQFGSHCGNFSSGVTPNSVSAFGFGVDLSFSFTILPVSLHFPGHIAVDFGP